MSFENQHNVTDRQNTFTIHLQRLEFEFLIFRFVFHKLVLDSTGGGGDSISLHLDWKYQSQTNSVHAPTMETNSS